MGSNMVAAEWSGGEVRRSEDSFPLEASATSMSPPVRLPGSTLLLSVTVF